MPIVLGGTPYSAEALMAHLLRAIVDGSPNGEGGKPRLVVLTHPANYTEYKKGLLEESARLAGLDLASVRFVTEPEAAVTHASQERIEAGELVAVYDFGGGTFDAAPVQGSRWVRVDSRPEGMDRLGGIDIDQAVLAHVDRSLDGILAQVDSDEPSVRRVSVACETTFGAKESLSADTDTSIMVSLPGCQLRCA